MSKILLNPESGAQIKNIWYKSHLYLSEKENDTFKIASIRAFDDELADFLTNLYQFLEPLTPEQANNWKVKAIEYKCDYCEFKTDTKIALAGHSRTHEKKIIELNIPVTKLANTADSTQEEVDIQKKIDNESKAEGLTGEGLTEDYLSKPGAIMN